MCRGTERLSHNQSITATLFLSTSWGTGDNNLMPATLNLWLRFGEKLKGAGHDIAPIRIALLTARLGRRTAPESSGYIRKR